MEEDESSREGFQHSGHALAGRPLHEAQGFRVGLKEVGEKAQSKDVVTRGQAIVQQHRGQRHCQVPGNLELITD